MQLHRLERRRAAVALGIRPGAERTPRQGAVAVAGIAGDLRAEPAWPDEILGRRRAARSRRSPGRRSRRRTRRSPRSIRRGGRSGASSRRAAAPMSQQDLGVVQRERILDLEAPQRRPARLDGEDRPLRVLDAHADRARAVEVQIGLADGGPGDHGSPPAVADDEEPTLDLVLHDSLADRTGDGKALRDEGLAARRRGEFDRRQISRGAIADQTSARWSRFSRSFPRRRADATDACIASRSAD